MNLSFLQAASEKVLGKPVQLFGAYSEGGGEINSYHKLLTDQGVFFVKAHHLEERPRMFEREISGLEALRKIQCLDVVRSFGTTSLENYELLFLDYLEPAPPSSNYWEMLGAGLAAMHRHSSKSFGFSDDNFIHGQVQLNHRQSKWGSFFINNRLLPNIRRAFEQQRLEPDLLTRLEKFMKLAEVVFPEEPPALLHGNLWNKHLLTNVKGEPVLISPSPYYGHREMDLAMTRLVGTFPDEFYKAYQDAYPLQPEWELRLDFGHVYYLLVYLNAYGAPYVQTLEEKLNKWVGE